MHPSETGTFKYDLISCFLLLLHLVFKGGLDGSAGTSKLLLL